jgi:hypothetical protein
VTCHIDVPIARGAFYLSDYDRTRRLSSFVQSHISPKLTAVAFMREADTFASRLEKAIQRSNGAKLIEARAEPTD